MYQVAKPLAIFNQVGVRILPKKMLLTRRRFFDPQRRPRACLCSIPSNCFTTGYVISDAAFNASLREDSRIALAAVSFDGCALKHVPAQLRSLAQRDRRGTISLRLVAYSEFLSGFCYRIFFPDMAVILEPLKSWSALTFGRRVLSTILPSGHLRQESAP